MKTSFILATVFFAQTSWAGLLFSYARLATKDLDQMSKIVQEKIAESKKVQGDKSIPLKEALQAVFSRPNDDAMIEKVLPSLKQELDRKGSWEKSVRNLVKEAVGALKNARGFKPEAQVTYAIFLENLVAEFKPRAKEQFEKSILSQIRDAQIELTKESVRERKLRIMKEGPSPSELAKLVIEEIEEQEKAEREAAEAAASPETTAEPSK